MVNEEAVCVDELILQTFEDETSHDFIFPVESQKEARSFVKVLHSKGVAYEDFCQEINEFEHNFSAWRKGLGRSGIGQRVMQRINGPIQEVIDSSDEEEEDSETENSSSSHSSNGVSENISRLRLVGTNGTTQHSGNQSDYTESTVSSTPNNTTIISLKKSTTKEATLHSTTQERPAGNNELQQSPLFKRQSFRTSNRREGSESPKSPPGALSPKDLSPKHESKGSATRSPSTSSDQGDSQPSSPYMQSKFQRAGIKTDNQPNSPFGSMRLRKTERLEALVNKSFTQEGSGPAKYSAASSSLENRSTPIADRWSPQSPPKQLSPEEPGSPALVRHTDHKALRLTSTDGCRPSTAEKHTEKVKTPPGVTENKSPSPENEKITITSLRLKLFGEEAKKKVIDENYNSDLDDDGMDVEDFHRAYKELYKIIKTHKPKAGHLYVLTDSVAKAPQQRVKIGGSRFPDKRLEQAQSFNLHIQKMLSLPVSDCKSALADMLGEMEQFKVPGCGDWFKAPGDEIKALAEKVAANYGDSDC